MHHKDLKMILRNTNIPLAYMPKPHLVQAKRLKSYFFPYLIVENENINVKSDQNVSINYKSYKIISNMP